MSSEGNRRSSTVDGRGLTIAAVQMDANPAPTTDRLARAERLVAATAESGAQLTVLPELFNTGYSYSLENHTRIEPLDGPTVTWMRDSAARHGVHLAGSLMLLDQGEVYNALLLFAPDGRMWRYDKVYPWGWERSFFRESRREPKVTVAETDLGKIGMLVCWDAAHPSLWEQYAGRVDLMAICSCPPNVSDATYHFPSGDQVSPDDIRLVAANIRGSTQLVFGDTINRQAAWLGVPAVNSVGCGHIRTDVPSGRLSLLGLALAAPGMLRYLPQADRFQLSCDMVHQCKVVNSRGEVLASLAKEDGEGFVLGDACLAEHTPSPRGRQPVSLISGPVYFFSDVLLPAIAKSVYQTGRRWWGDASQQGRP